MPSLAPYTLAKPKSIKSQERASSVLKAMANAHRLKILCHLSHQESSVSELEEITGLSQSALSQHLAKLRQGKLVKTRRNAQTIHYSLDGDVALLVLSALQDAKLL